MATLQLNRLIIYKQGNIVYNETFHSGVNIIRGDNGVGKSTIANSIYYLLGGDFTKWLPEIRKCDYIIGEVLFNEKILTLKREITLESMRPMYVFYGNYDSSTKDAVNWIKYDYRRNSKSISFSQMMFQALGYPEVETSDEEYITFNQALRLMYIDQISPLDELMKDIDFDSPLIRKTTADLLLGIYDNELFTLQLLNKELKKNESVFESELKLLKNIYKNVEIEKIQEWIDNNQIKLDEIEKALQNNSIIYNQNSIKKENRIKEIQIKIKNNSEKLKKKIDEQSLLEYDILDSKEFINELKKQIHALSESDIIRGILGDLKINFCPSCLQSISTEFPLDTCKLCKEPIEKDISKSQIFRIKQQLDAQVKESSTIVDNNENELNEINKEIDSLRKEIRKLQKEVNIYITTNDSDYNYAFREMLVEKGKLLQQIDGWNNELITAKKYWSIYADYERTRKEIKQTEEKIITKKNNQIKNYKIALEQINKYARILLNGDGEYETPFHGPEQINLDFYKNSYALGERNNFSASSQVILKNSIRFGILFASLALQFMRFPKFILCDNIEDKGMNEARSRTFQKNLVKIANREEFKNCGFQIIFTTSMIDSEINIPEYTIGDYYTRTKKALDLDLPPKKRTVVN